MPPLQAQNPIRNILDLAACQVRHASTLLQKLCIAGQRLENVRLPQRELDFLLLIIEIDNKVLDLPRKSAPCNIQTDRVHAYLVSPQKSIALLVFRIAPDG